MGEDATLLARLAPLRHFDEQTFGVVAEDLGEVSFGDVSEHWAVEEVRGEVPRYRVHARYRKDLENHALTEDRQTRAAVAARLANLYGSGDEPDAVDALKHLATADPKAAQARLKTLFESAAGEWDVDECDRLLSAVSRRTPHPGWDALLLDLVRSLNSRKMWRQFYYRTVWYQARPEVDQALTDLLDPALDHWLLQVHAPGGTGKTMFIQHLVSHTLLDDEVPAALVDCDMLPNLVTIASEPWRLLLMIAEQLQRQLGKQVFASLLNGFGEFAPDVRTRAYTRRPARELLRQPEQVRESVIGQFKGELENAIGGKRCVVIVDTLEELILRVDPPLVVGLFTLLQDIAKAVPGFLVVAAGRYDLTERHPDRVDLVDAFVAAFEGEMQTVGLEAFSAHEARSYLEQKRGVRSDLVNVLVPKPKIEDWHSRIVSEGESAIDAFVEEYPAADKQLLQSALEEGTALRELLQDATSMNPMLAAMLADYVLGNPDISLDEIKTYRRMDLFYVLDRVIDRIQIRDVRWLVRWGSLTRGLSRNLVVKVLAPLLERRAELDNWREDQHTGVARPSRWEDGRDPWDPKDLWDELQRYASSASWVYLRTRYGEPVLEFHPEVRRPLRELIDDREIAALLHGKALEYYRQEAESGGSVLAFREAVFHAHALHDEKPGLLEETWRELLDRTDLGSEARKVLASEIIRLDDAPARVVAEAYIELADAHVGLLQERGKDVAQLCRSKLSKAANLVPDIDRQPRFRWLVAAGAWLAGDADAEALCEAASEMELAPQDAVRCRTVWALSADEAGKVVAVERALLAFETSGSTPELIEEHLAGILSRWEQHDRLLARVLNGPVHWEALLDIGRPENIQTRRPEWDVRRSLALHLSGNRDSKAKLPLLVEAASEAFEFNTARALQRWKKEGSVESIVAAARFRQEYGEWDDDREELVLAAPGSWMADYYLQRNAAMRGDSVDVITLYRRASYPGEKVMARVAALAWDPKPKTNFKHLARDLQAIESPSRRLVLLEGFRDLIKAPDVAGRDEVLKMLSLAQPTLSVVQKVRLADVHRALGNVGEARQILDEATVLADGLGQQRLVLLATDRAGWEVDPPPRSAASHLGRLGGIVLLEHAERLMDRDGKAADVSEAADSSRKFLGRSTEPAIRKRFRAINAWVAMKAEDIERVDRLLKNVTRPGSSHGAWGPRSFSLRAYTRSFAWLDEARAGSGSSPGVDISSDHRRDNWLITVSPDGDQWQVRTEGPAGRSNVRRAMAGPWGHLRAGGKRLNLDYKLANRLVKHDARAALAEALNFGPVLDKLGPGESVGISLPNDPSWLPWELLFQNDLEEKRFLWRLGTKVDSQGEELRPEVVQIADASGQIHQAQAFDRGAPGYSDAGLRCDDMQAWSPDELMKAIGGGYRVIHLKLPMRWGTDGAELQLPDGTLGPEVLARMLGPAANRVLVLQPPTSGSEADIMLAVLLRNRFAAQLHSMGSAPTIIGMVDHGGFSETLLNWARALQRREPLAKCFSIARNSETHLLIRNTMSLTTRDLEQHIELESY